MRILHVSHAWDAGGSGLYASAVAAAQARAGHDVRRFGPVPRRERGFRASWSSPEVEIAFLAEVRGVEVVHVHHLSGLSMDLPRLAREAGARVVVTLHDYWLACARGQLVDASGDRCPGPDIDRCARCLAPHLWAPLPFATSLPLRRASVADRLGAWTMLRDSVDRFLAPSAHVARRLCVEAQSLPLPLLLPVEVAPPAPPGPVRFLLLGTLVPTKGAHVAIEAFAGLPSGSGELRVVGPAPPYDGSNAYAERLRARAAEVPGVRLEGPVPHAAVAHLLHGADVLLVPSLWEENAPLVVGEALASGLRVLASDLGGIGEVAPQARLVEPGTVAAWRAAMAAEIRRGRGRDSPVLRDTIDAHAATLLALYAELRAA